MAPPYLKRRHNAWYVRVQLPRRLWGVAGRREFVKALGTTDLKVADRRKHHHVAEFKRRIVELERGSADPFRKVFEKALEFKDMLEANAGLMLGLPEYAGDVSVNDMVLSDAYDAAKDLLAEHGEETAGRFMRVVKGQAAFLRDLYPRWLDETGPAPKQRDLHLVAVRSFLDWGGANITVQEVDRGKAGAFVSYLLDGTRTRRTVGRYRSTLATLWAWMGEKGLADAERNPWHGHKSIRAAGRPGMQRTGLNDEQLQKLLSGSYSGDVYRQVIADLTRLGLATGARLEELGGLKRSDALKRSDGYWLAIRKGKTEAAAREIPIHMSVEHIIERRVRGNAEYLFNDLTPGPYGRRTHHLSKAYGRFRVQVGVGERGADFHALRHTFTAMMEGAGVPITTIQLLVGHSRRKSMGTTAVYTQGERVDLRKAIERLQYSRDVMRLLAENKGDATRHGAPSTADASPPEEAVGGSLAATGMTKGGIGQA